MIVLFVAIIGISILGFYLPKVKELLMINTQYQGQYWRWITHGFVHANWSHLFFNMWVLWQFMGHYPAGVEFRLFSPLALAYGTFFLGVLMGNLSSLKKPRGYRALGASGGVSAILMQYILLFPTSKLYLFFIPIGIPAILFGALYVWYEYDQHKKGKAGIDHAAHLYGMMGGAMLTVVVVPHVLENMLNELILLVWG